MLKATEKNYTQALWFLADATRNKMPGAPGLDEAIAMATQAEAAGVEKAKDLREVLEKQREEKNTSAAEEAARARST